MATKEELLSQLSGLSAQNSAPVDMQGPKQSKEDLLSSLSNVSKIESQPQDNSQWMQERYPAADGLILDYLKQMQSKGADVRAINAVYKKQYPQGQINAQMPPLETSPVPERETGVTASIGDWFSGKQRRTPQSEAIPDMTDTGAIGDMMSNISEEDAKKFATIDFFSWNADEIAKMATAINPELDIVENIDAEGNPYPILVKPSTGQSWEVDPAGTSMTGGIKALGTIGTFNPSSLAAKQFGQQLLKEGLVQGGKKRLLAQAGMGATTSGLTQASIEAAQDKMGGDVNASDIAIAGAGGGVGEVAGPLIKSGLGYSKAGLGKAKELIKGLRGVDDLNINAPQQAAKTADEISKIRIEQASKGFETNDAGEVIGGVERQVSQALQAGDEQRLAKMIDADPEFFADKDALGLLESGIPTQSSVIPAVRQTGENLSKAQGSDLYTAMKAQQEELGEKANEIAQKYGAGDKGVVDFDAFEQGQKAIDDIAKQEGEMYKQITDKVYDNPKNIDVALENTAKAIRAEADKSAKGIDSLDSLEKELLDYADNGATYKDLDRLRKKVGESLHGKKDVFPNVSEGSLKNLYKLLSQDQEIAAKNLGVGDLWDLAKQVSKDKFSLQDKAKVLFGKNLDKQNLTSQLSSSMKDIKSNSKRFKEIIKSLPSGSPEAEKQRLQVLATAMQDIFKGGTTKGEGFNIGQFAKWYEKLNKSTTYKSMLYKELPKEFRKELDMLGRFTSKLDKAVKDGRNTGVNLASAEMANKLQNSTKRFLGRQLGKITRGLIESGETLSKSEANKMVADKANLVLNDPNFINLVKAAANQKAETVKRIEGRLMKTKAMSEFKQSLTPAQRTALINQGFVQWFNNEYGEKEMTSGDKVGPMP